MLAPRFTLRTGLLWLTLGAAFAVVLREAVRESPWAIGVVVALAASALSLAMQAVAFALSLALSRDRSDGEA